MRRTGVRGEKWREEKKYPLLNFSMYVALTYILFVLIRAVSRRTPNFTAAMNMAWKSSKFMEPLSDGSVTYGDHIIIFREREISAKSRGTL